MPASPIALDGAIDLQSQDAVDAWCACFRATPAQLQAAVAAVGTDPAAVAGFLEVQRMLARAGALPCAGWGFGVRRDR